MFTVGLRTTELIKLSVPNQPQRESSVIGLFEYRQVTDRKHYFNLSTPRSHLVASVTDQEANFNPSPLLNLVAKVID